MPFIGYRAKKFNVPATALYGDESNTLSGSSTPATPASGLAEVWFDSSLKKWRIIYDNGVIESLGVGLSGAVAHKDTHKSGGSDPFVKTDVLNTASRYLETISDPASDAGAFWLVDGGLDIKYWDDQGTPVKQTLERRSLKGAANGYCDLDGSALIPTSRLPSGFVRTDVANIFTEPQTISKAVTDLLTLYRSSNTIGHTVGFNLDAQNATPAQFTYGRIRTEIVDNTAGNEDSKLLFYLARAGATVAGLAVENDGGLAFGANLRGKFNDTGLSTFRNYTLPDLDTKLAGLSLYNLFLTSQSIETQGSLNEVLELYHNSNTVDQSVGIINMMKDSNSAYVNIGSVYSRLKTNTAGSVDGEIELWNRIAGTLTKSVTINKIGSLVANKGFALDNAISPAQITSDQNDYNPTGLQAADTLRLDGDSSFRTISGIVAPSPDVSKVLRLVNISNNTILLTNQDTGSSAVNRFDFKGYDMPLFPKKEIVINYDKTLDRWVCEDLQSHVIPPAGCGFYYRNDCFGTAADNYTSFKVLGTAAANTNVAAEAGHYGIQQHETGSTSTGAAAIQGTNQDNIFLGQNWYWRCETMIRIPTLSDGTNRFGVECGFFDNFTGAPVDGVYAFYKDDVNTGKWRLTAVSNSVTTNADDTGTAVAANTWYKLVIIIHPSGTEARLYVNGTEIAASLSSGLPTGAGRQTTLGNQIFKTLGGTMRNFQTDYIEVIGYANTVS